MKQSKVQHFVSEETGETYSIFGHPLSDQERERRGQMTCIACPPEENRTRQEDRDVNSVEMMVAKYGPNFWTMNQRRDGDFDQELDLQRALEVRAEAAAAYQRLPEVLRDHYASLEEVAAAAERGEISKLLEAAKEKEPESKPATGSAPAVSEAKP